MRGLLLAGVLCILICVQYASSQWPNWVLTKGVVCEDRCKKIKNCDPLNEFSACKCFPRQYVKKWLQYNTLPMEPHLVCLMSWAGVVPKCCDIYKKEKDSYKNCASEIEDANEELKNGHGAEIEELKTKIEQLQKKLGSCEQDGGDRTSNLTAEMLALILEQNRNQNQELEELKMRFDEKSGQLEKRLDAAEDASELLSEQNSNHSQVIAQLEGRLDSGEEDGERLTQLTAGMANSITTQNQELQNLTQAWSNEPWKPFATELVKSVAAPSSIGFFAYLKKDTLFPNKVVLKFDRVVTNTGGGYNSSTGVFTCPENGTYQFTFATLVKTDGGQTNLGVHFCQRQTKFLFSSRSKGYPVYWC